MIFKAQMDLVIPGVIRIVVQDLLLAQVVFSSIIFYFFRLGTPATCFKAKWDKEMAHIFSSFNVFIFCLQIVLI